jgi:hypothetical protein
MSPGGMFLAILGVWTLGGIAIGVTDLYARQSRPTTPDLSGEIPRPKLWLRVVKGAIVAGMLLYPVFLFVRAAQSIQ